MKRIILGLSVFLISTIYGKGFYYVNNNECHYFKLSVEDMIKMGASVKVIKNDFYVIKVDSKRLIGAKTLEKFIKLTKIIKTQNTQQSKSKSELFKILDIAVSKNSNQLHEYLVSLNNGWTLKEWSKESFRYSGTIDDMEIKIYFENNTFNVFSVNEEFPMNDNKARSKFNKYKKLIFDMYKPKQYTRGVHHNVKTNNNSKCNNTFYGADSFMLTTNNLQIEFGYSLGYRNQCTFGNTNNPASFFITIEPLK